MAEIVSVILEWRTTVLLVATIFKNSQQQPSAD